ncbi:MAG: Arc family DNA binding domain-containing protein [Bacteroidales bacterium]|nr:Arc family DNA binding domain-containing protein [Bacteroidales bacterium]
MKKSFVLRVDEELYAALEKWAVDEYRSTNGQVEFLLSEALKKAKRMPKKKKGDGNES